MLRDKAKWTHHNQRSDLKRGPRIGEIVVVHQEGQPRNVWPLGKIIELDGTPARSAKIKIGNKTFIRPINKISPLEIEENMIEDNSNKELENEKDLTVEDSKKVDKRNRNTHPMVTRSKVALCLQFVQLIYLITIAFAQPPRYINCKGCFMKCRTFGAEANAVEYINKIELCCAGSCLLETNGISRLKFIIPKDKTTLEYKCRATYWGKRYMYRDWISCPAVDPCLRIAGVRERIFNPQCESTESLILIGIVVGLILAITLAIGLFALRILSIFGSLLKLIWYILKMPFGILFVQKKNKQKDVSEKLLLNKADNKKRIKRNRRLNKLSLLALLAIFSNSIQIISGEVEVVVIQAKSEDCQRKGGISTCKMNAINTVTLLPNEQINSLSLKNNKGNIMGELELSMHGLQIQCNQKILRYLRSYEVKVQSIKRCPAAGTCKAGRCNHIRTKDYVEELSE
uniref:DUF5641 domain-containing protein n=1 Tax=Meloidogyne hapla TaxID=6305 RepID=A0A1I8AX27_MELHA